MESTRRMIAVVIWLQILTATHAAAQIRILTQREQATLQRVWIERRFDVILPDLMRHEGIDMWLIISREYDDDPVFRSMVPPTVFSSRRRTILVLYDQGPKRGLEKLSIGRFDYDGLFKLERTHNDSQWEGLRAVVERRNPRTIGINSSELFSHADGLSANEKENLIKTLGPTFAARLRSAEKLAVGWLEAKLPEETDTYRHVMQVAHQVIAEAFSNKVIVPGVTTTQDVSWWMRQRAVDMGLGLWFHPAVTAWRLGDSADQPETGARVIQRGDLLHCDFGIVYLGFATDTQHHAYVLLPQETDAPAGLKEGLRAANQLQDITVELAKAGTTGNAVLAAALAAAKKAGLNPSVYCHPVGYHGHAAGPPVGMVDYQSGVPGRGDYQFHANTWQSIELNVVHRVKEWNDQPVRFALEEDGVILESGFSWIDGRQTQFYLIR